MPEFIYGFQGSKVFNLHRKYNTSQLLLCNYFGVICIVYSFNTIYIFCNINLWHLWLVYWLEFYYHKIHDTIKIHVFLNWIKKQNLLFNFVNEKNMLLHKSERPWKGIYKKLPHFFQDLIKLFIIPTNGRIVDLTCSTRSSIMTTRTCGRHLLAF